MLTPRAFARPRAHLRLFGALCLAAAGSAAFAAGAQAYPQGHFACFGTAVHADRPLNGSLIPGDPVIANPFSAPCQADSQSGTVSATNGSGTTVVARGATAGTSNTQDYNPADNRPPVVGDNGTAQGAAQSILIVAPGVVIKADALSAQAKVACTSVGSSSANTTGSFSLTGSASVGSLTINGSPVALTGGPQTIPTAAGTLYVDAAYQPVSFALFQRALWLQTPSGDIIAGEAAVAGVNGFLSQYGAGGGPPCQDGPAPSLPPPTAAFGCQGTAAQFFVNHNPINPFVANPSLGPCVTSHASAVNFGLASDFVVVKAPYGDTANQPDPLPSSTPYPDGTTSSADAGAAGVQIGSSLGAGPVSSHSSVTCTNHSFVVGGSSQIAGLHIGAASIPDLSTPMNIPVLGGTLHINWTGGAANYTEHRAIWFESTLGYDVVVGDTIAGTSIDSSGKPLSPC